MPFQRIYRQPRRWLP